MPLPTAKDTRKIDIIGMSMTELLMLVAFLFLVVLSIYYRQLREGEEAQREYVRLGELTEEGERAALQVEALLFGEAGERAQPSSVVARAEGVNRVLEKLRDEASTDAARDVLDEMPLPEVWNTLHKAQEDLAAVQAENRKLESFISEEKSLLDEVRRLNVQLKEAQDKAEQLGAEKAKTTAQLAGSGFETVSQLVKRHGEIKGQLVDLSKRAGVGDPACWTTPQGRIEYLYHIDIHDDGFYVTGIWPQERKEDLKATGGEAFTERSRKMNADEFRRNMMSLWKYGHSQENQCRFFVTVRDNTSPVSKQAWQHNLQLVEDVFYKKVVK